MTIAWLQLQLCNYVKLIEVYKQSIKWDVVVELENNTAFVCSN